MSRKQHNYHYIYKTTCRVTGNFYVGMHSTSNLEDKYLGSGKRLWYSIRKHGKENHLKEILEFLPDRNSLKDREREIVNEKFLKDPKCMNLKIGGEGGDHGIGLKNLTREQRIEFAIDRWKNPEYKEKIKAAVLAENKRRVENKTHHFLTNRYYDWTGKKHSAETIQQMKESKKNHGIGEKNSQFGTIWITKNKENKKIKSVNFQEWHKNGWIKGRYYSTI